MVAKGKAEPNIEETWSLCQCWDDLVPLSGSAQVHVAIVATHIPLLGTPCVLRPLLLLGIELTFGDKVFYTRSTGFEFRERWLAILTKDMGSWSIIKMVCGLSIIMDSPSRFNPAISGSPSQRPDNEGDGSPFQGVECSLKAVHSACALQGLPVRERESPARGVGEAALLTVTTLNTGLKTLGDSGVEVLCRFLQVMTSGDNIEVNKFADLEAEGMRASKGCKKMDMVCNVITHTVVHSTFGLFSPAKPQNQLQAPQL